MPRTYAAIDLKSFFASVECILRGLDPLKAKLVVADESRTEKTICLAVTPALKAYGIPGRARLFEVNQKVREVQRKTGEKIEFTIAKPQMAKYVEYSTKVYNVYLKYVSEGKKNTYHSIMAVLDNYRKHDTPIEKEEIRGRYIAKYQIDYTDIDVFDEIFDTCFEIFTDRTDI